MHTYIYLVLHTFKLLLDLRAVKGLSDQQKDIEILLLRHQPHILQRKLPQSPRISIWEKGILAVLAAQFGALTKDISKSIGRRLDESILLFKPDTVLRWHRNLVRRKWTFRRVEKPPIAPELQELAARLATENRR